MAAPCLHCMITRDGGSTLNLWSISWDRDKYQAYIDLNQMTSLIWSCDVTPIKKKEASFWLGLNWKCISLHFYSKAAYKCMSDTYTLINRIHNCVWKINICRKTEKKICTYKKPKSSKEDRKITPLKNNKEGRRWSIKYHISYRFSLMKQI